MINYLRKHGAFDIEETFLNEIFVPFQLLLKYLLITSAEYLIFYLSLLFDSHFITLLCLLLFQAFPQ